MKKVECKEVSIDGQHWMRTAVSDGHTIFVKNIGIADEEYPFRRNQMLEVDDDLKLEELL